MGCYFIAQIRITDPEAYEKYLARVDAVVARFEGEYLAVDDLPIVLEGDWGSGRFVLIRFPSEDAVKEWYFSEEYQGIVGYRLAAAESRAVVVREGEAV